MAPPLTKGKASEPLFSFIRPSGYEIQLVSGATDYESVVLEFIWICESTLKRQRYVGVKSNARTTRFVDFADVMLRLKGIDLTSL